MKKLVYKISMALLVLGALNMGSIGAFRVNFLDRVAGRMNFTRWIYILIGIAAVSVMLQRDFYLPFLGETLVPCSAIKEKVPEGATFKTTVRVSPGQKLLYWAAEPKTEKFKQVESWHQAYLGYENAGVTVADEKGVALIQVRPPQHYTVPFKGTLPPHIHYRVCQAQGMLGPVQTLWIQENGQVSQQNPMSNAAAPIQENFLYRFG